MVFCHAIQHAHSTRSILYILSHFQAIVQRMPLVEKCQVIISTFFQWAEFVANEVCNWWSGVYQAIYTVGLALGG